MIRRAAVPAALIFLLPILVTAGVSSSSAAPVAPQPASATHLANLGTLAREHRRHGRLEQAREVLAGPHHPRVGSVLQQPEQGLGRQPPQPGADLPDDPVQQGLPGHQEARPVPEHAKSNFPSTIRIALYSFSDNRVADALIRAHRRCVSVKVLMNDHLSNRDVPAFGRLQRALGYDRDRRSYARRCKEGCRGSHGPLHTKMYLFTKTGKAANVVGVRQHEHDRQGRQRPVERPVRLEGPRGPVQPVHDDLPRVREGPPGARTDRAQLPQRRRPTMFWPQPGHTKATDRVMRALRRSSAASGRPAAPASTGTPRWPSTSTRWRATVASTSPSTSCRMRKAGCRVRVLYGLDRPAHPPDLQGRRRGDPSHDLRP